MDFLKNHPFAVEAFFKSSSVLTFAIPKEELEPLIPDILELDTFQDKYAFIAIAMVQTEALRPKGFPVFMGNNFFLIGYRVFVRYKDKRGKKLRGLYILKSETDKLKMQIMGNIFTHYQYTTTDILQEETVSNRKISSVKSKFQLDIDKTITAASIPNQSPFDNWKDARRFAGPLPHTFTYNEKDNSVLIIKGVRQDWKPQPIHVKDFSFQFLEDFDFSEIKLASAFEVKEIPYLWEKGKLEVW